MTEGKKYWMDDKRFILIGVFLLIIWLGFMIFYYLKADEITRDPCSICAEYMGEKVICSTGTGILLQRTYYPDGTMNENREKVLKELDSFGSPLEINSSIVWDLFK